MTGAGHLREETRALRRQVHVDAYDERCLAKLLRLLAAAPPAWEQAARRLVSTRGSAAIALEDAAKEPGTMVDALAQREH
jgi:predicted component of type VI protein secretion system